MLEDRVQFPCTEKLRDAWLSDTGVPIDEAVRLLLRDFGEYDAVVDVSCPSTSFYRLSVTFNKRADETGIKAANYSAQPVLKSEFVIDIDYESAYHNHICIDTDSKCKGAGTLFTFNRFSLYDRIGVRGVELKSAYSHGFMAWAKMGFVPDFEEPEAKAVVKQMLERVEANPDMFNEGEIEIVESLAEKPTAQTFQALFALRRDALDLLLEGHEDTPMVFDLHSEQRDFFHERLEAKFPHLTAEAA